MRIKERTLDPEELEKVLLDLLRPPASRAPAPVVCIDCYRDGGCREHSRPEEER